MDRLDKKTALNHWRSLSKPLPIKSHPIAYKHKGSTYGHDGIRVEGSREFIDAILSRLTDLMAYENTDTRLNLNYQKVQPREGKPASGGDWVCYVKIHQRGDEARAVNRRFGLVS